MPQRDGANWMAARWARVTALATVLLVFVGIGTAVVMARSDGSDPTHTVSGVTDPDAGGGDDAVNEGINNGNICTGNARCGDTTTTTRAPRRERPVSGNTTCPFPDPTVPERREVTICVLYWCKGDVYSVDGRLATDQYQIKVRPLITNYSDAAIDISVDKPSRIRLLVVGAELDRRWNPGPRTAEYGDRPIMVEHEGRTYWAIAPNRPRTETPASNGLYTGFASSWHGPPVLEPSATFGQVAREPRSENLVFQVPLDRQADGDSIANVLGLALIDFSDPAQPRVTALDFADEWPEREDPASF